MKKIYRLNAGFAGGEVKGVNIRSNKNKIYTSKLNLNFFSSLIVFES
ncbi:MAG: hypothetical protein QW803_00810 [Candidatus Methanomethylicia archaeon]